MGSYSILCVYKVLISLVRFKNFAVLRFSAACIEQFGIACRSHLLGLIDP